MKNRLIAALMVVTSLCSWNAFAVNPHVLEAKLDIEGVADSAEFDPGPGGFVAKDGWKKITLGYEGVPLRMRLNWESDKIAVYLTTNSLAPIENPTFWDVENGEIMPTNLWVKGLEVSETGPTDSTCGPEHICLEAINNGTSYVTPFYDRVGFTVVTVTNIEYCRMDNFDSEDADWVTKLNVAAGAKDTDVHKAKVRITIAPAVAGVPLVATNNGGGGYDIACVYMPNTTMNTDSEGQILGDYKSSDKIENVTIKITSLAGSPVSIDLGSTLSNKWDCSGEYDFSVPTWFVPEQSEFVYFFPTLEDIDGFGSIDNHEINYYTKNIKLQKFECDFASFAINIIEVNGTYPYYWYYTPECGMPTGLTVEDFVEHSPTTELTPEHAGVYVNAQTVHDFWDYDFSTDILTAIFVDQYDFGVYDMDVARDPDP